jgi:hypothetical protein
VKALRRVALVLLAFAAALLVLFVVVVSIGVRVDLGGLRAPVQAAASKLLDREVRIDGSLTLVPTWSPTVEIQGLRIANPPGWSTPEFARMELARVTVGVWPLLRRRAVVREFTAQGVEVDLERTASGRVNWLLAGSEPEAARSEDPAAASPRDPATGWIRELAIEELRLIDLIVDMNDALGGPEGRFELSDLEGALGTHEPLHLTARGKLGPEPYDLVIDGGPPIDLLRADAPWPLALAFDLAETRLGIETSLDQAVAFPHRGEGSPDAGPAPAEVRRAALTLTLSGDRVESLERLTGIDLPPWGPYSVRATAEAFTGDRFAGDLRIEVGASTLTGGGELKLSEPPRIEMDLTAPIIQLDDFSTEGWELIQKREGAEAAVDAATRSAADEPADQALEPPRAPLSAAALKRVNARLAISVDRVASGADRLGKGRVVLALENGRIRIEPLDVEVPGGGAHLEVTLEPTPDRLTASIRAQVKRFDYGIIARRLDPETEMGGLFGLDVDLTTWAPVGAPLMTNASGRFDVAVFPENMDAGLVDLWAVNLLSAITPAVDPSENSRLNCVVAMLDAADGVMRDHTLMLDTSKMTVGGNIAVDFRERHIDISLVPKAKRPEFFSLATPVKVSGSFEDFGVGLRPGSVVFTAVKMATSIVHVPVRRIFETGSSTDDLEECMNAIAARGASQPPSR